MAAREPSSGWSLARAVYDTLADWATHEGVRVRDVNRKGSSRARTDAIAKCEGRAAAVLIIVLRGHLDLCVGTDSAANTVLQWS